MNCTKQGQNKNNFVLTYTSDNQQIYSYQMTFAIQRLRCCGCGRQFQSSLVTAFTTRQTDNFAVPKFTPQQRRNFHYDGDDDTLEFPNLLNYDHEYGRAISHNGRDPSETRTRRKNHRHPPQGRYTLIDQEWARKVTKKLRTVINFKDPGNVIVECNPGSGLLTKSLVSRSKLSVIALEYKKNMSSELIDMAENRYFKRRLFLEKGSIIHLREHLKKINKLRCTDTPSFQEVYSPIKLLGTTFPVSMFPSFINTLSFEIGAQNHVYSLGRVENFLFVPATELKVIGHKTKKDQLYNLGTLRSALYKVFFDVKVLMKVPPEAFGIKGRNGNGSNGHDGHDIYLIRIVPRYPLPCPAEGIPNLVHLLRELRKKRGKTVEDAIESLYPDLTEAVFASGFSEQDDISGLSVSQLLKIYEVLSPHLESLAFDPDEDATSTFDPAEEDSIATFDPEEETAAPFENDKELSTSFDPDEDIDPCFDDSLDKSPTFDTGEDITPSFNPSEEFNSDFDLYKNSRRSY